MHEHTISVLEFEKIRSEAAEYCVSEEGRELVLSQTLFYDPDALGQFHQYVEELREYLERADLPSLEFPALRELNLSLRTEGMVLEGEEIYRFARYFRSAGRLKNFLHQAEDFDYGLLSALADKMDDFQSIGREISKVLNPDGTVQENHPELKSRRRQLVRLREEVNQVAQSYLRNSPDHWQSDVPTQRDGRIVLPLKNQYRHTVSGVIQHSSARGATVYIEPPEIMGKNNDIALLEEEIREIILAILRELTGKLAEVRNETEVLMETVAEIDSYLCRSRYARAHRCVRALPRERGFALVRARHPLLRKNAVPIDIETSEDIRALIISGPNAGGKTVTLKTVGILALMNQFGMQIPAEEGSELAIFNGIYADIGDEQSIEGSLSTFSGHMKEISDMLDHADNKSLVLLDELGSGTDPGEGATLGKAILEECIKRGATVLVTSHHSLLKNYAYTTAHVQNASMDFDSSTLTPNYRVIVGLPGESRALDIAARSGIPEAVIKKARDYFSHDSGEVSRMIRELEKKQSDLRKLEGELASREEKLRQQIKDHDLSVLRLRRKEHELKKSGYSELNQFLHSSRQELENLVSELKGSAASRRNLSKEDTKRVKEFIAKIEEKTESEQKGLESEEASFSENVQHEFAPGMEVIAGPGKRKGKIVRAGKKNQWVVEVGAMKIALPEKDLTPVEDKGGDKKQAPQVTYGFSSDSSPAAAQFVLDLRGRRLDEALDMLKRQIDNALLQGLHEFQVVHGKGEGILQSGVQRLLGESPRVADFYFSRPEQGGTGKTIVKLKD